MDALIAALHAAVGHKIVVMVVVMTAILAVLILFNPRSIKTRIALAMLALLAFGNTFAGHRALGWLLDRYGVEGTGAIVSAQETSSRLNGRNVKRYEAVIRTADGRTVQAHFDGFALPLYPAPEDGFVFPSIGVEFGVRYLASSPHVFSIRTDGGSAYARGLDCAALAGAMREAQARHRFDRSSTDFRLAYAQAMSAFANAGCAQSQDRATAQGAAAR